MGNIVLLDELTINKIAAGEVIERPASVIKEMVENSIDAGATHVTVEVKNGGISFIRITDDGKGIAKDDIEIAFERHATSKIRTAEDLDTVKSMGFRGEALASIAAIANVELVSKTENDEIGSRIVIEGGDVLSLDEIGCSKGTTITVRNLFFNTPVRYKFLKKDFTESGYIEDVVTRIALIHPEVAIRFINSGKTIIQTNGNGDTRTTIYSIFGKEIANNIIPVEYEYEYIKINGVIGKPDISRSNRSNQIFFINERYVKDKTLSSAAEQAFKGMLPIGKFAFLVLNVEMPPVKVDVNVHPAKLEVRFAEENIVFKAMFHAIKDTLLKSGFMSDREKTNEIKEASKEAFKIDNVEEIAQKTYTVNNNEQEQTQNNGNILDKKFADMEMLEKLKVLQEGIKKEVEQNPDLQLTSEYKEMTQKYNQIMGLNSDENEVTEQHVEESEIHNEIIEEPKEGEQAQSETTEVKVNEVIEPQIENSALQNEVTQEVEMQNEITEGQTEEAQIQNQVTQEFEIPNEANYMEAEEIEIPSNQEQEPVEQVEENEVVSEEINETIQENKVSFEEMYRQLFGKSPYGGKVQEEPKDENFYTIDGNMNDTNVSMFEDDAEYGKIKYKFIGIAFDTYIILEINDELYIMDQHAAHERIMYEKVKANFFEEGEKNSQLLLLPDIITLTHKEMDIAKDNMSLFRQAGFILEEFGENTIKLEGVPEVCVNLNTEELFKETLDEINTVARTAKQEKEEKFIATVACKAAVKANMKLTKEEVDSLMNKLLELPNPFTCPHGRPTVIKMSKYEIERKFARK